MCSSDLNFERFVFDFMGRDGNATASMFKQVDEVGGFDISKDTVFKSLGQYGFQSGRSTHANRLDTIRDIEKKYGIMIDTHTADGIKVGLQYREANVPLVCLETAQPVKFSATIREALGRDPLRPAGFDNLESLPQRVEVMDVDAEAVKRYIHAHTGNLDQAR